MGDSEGVKVGPVGCSVGLTAGTGRVGCLVGDAVGDGEQLDFRETRMFSEGRLSKEILTTFRASEPSTTALDSKSTNTLLQQDVMTLDFVEIT